MKWQNERAYTAKAVWVAFVGEASIQMNVNLSDPPIYNHYLTDTQARRLCHDLTKALKAAPALRRQYAKRLRNS